MPDRRILVRGYQAVGFLCLLCELSYTFPSAGKPAQVLELIRKMLVVLSGQKMISDSGYH